jgi:hypothetical protein
VYSHYHRYVGGTSASRIDHVWVNDQLLKEVEPQSMRMVYGTMGSEMFCHEGVLAVTNDHYAMKGFFTNDALRSAGCLAGALPRLHHHRIVKPRDLNKDDMKVITESWKAPGGLEEQAKAFLEMMGQDSPLMSDDDMVNAVDQLNTAMMEPVKKICDQKSRVVHNKPMRRVRKIFVGAKKEGRTELKDEETVAVREIVRKAMEADLRKRRGAIYHGSLNGKATSEAKRQLHARPHGRDESYLDENQSHKTARISVFSLYFSA